MSRFGGFGPEALDFFAGLVADNSKAYWADHRDTYERAVRGPMLAMLGDLEAEFGAAKVFRPYRDVRFSADKRPYKDHIGAFTGPSPSREGAQTGLYVQLSAEGLYAGGGRYAFDRDTLERYRTAVGTEHAGRALERVVAGLEAAGHEIGGESLKRAPRGVDPGHPRIALLRRKGLHSGRSLGAGVWLDGPQGAARVAATWREVAPLNDWLGRHVP